MSSLCVGNLPLTISLRKLHLVKAIKNQSNVSNWTCAALSGLRNARVASGRGDFGGGGAAASLLTGVCC